MFPASAVFSPFREMSIFENHLRSCSIWCPRGQSYICYLCQNKLHMSCGKHACHFSTLSLAHSHLHKILPHINLRQGSNLSGYKDKNRSGCHWRLVPACRLEMRLRGRESGSFLGIITCMPMSIAGRLNPRSSICRNTKRLYLLTPLTSRSLRSNGGTNFP